MSASRFTSQQSLFPAKDNDAAFGHWLSGFTDGEGSLMLYLQKQRDRYTPHARFSIELRADDRPILETIRLFLDCGKICDRGRGNRCSTMATFAVQSVPCLAEKVIPHFERFPLRAKKAADFEFWKQGIALIMQVRSRPRKASGINRESYCRWTGEDIAQYRSILLNMRKARSFKSASSPVPLG